MTRKILLKPIHEGFFILIFIIFFPAFSPKKMSLFWKFLLFEIATLKITLKYFFLSSVFFKVKTENIRESFCPQKIFFWLIHESLCLRSAKIFRIFYLTKVSAPKELKHFTFYKSKHITL